MFAHHSNGENSAVYTWRMFTENSVDVCTSCSSQQDLGLCIGTLLYNIYSSQTFFFSCIKEIIHSNNDLRTINPFPAWLNTVVLLIWCLGLSNLHVKQEYFHFGTWMKSFAHEVKLTFLQKETTEENGFSLLSLYNQEKDLHCMILISLKGKAAEPFLSVLEGEDAHPEAFVLASASRTPELTPFSYCFLLYREFYICV